MYLNEWIQKDAIGPAQLWLENTLIGVSKLSANFISIAFWIYDSTYKVQLIRGGRVKEGSFCFMQCATQCSCSLLGQHHGRMGTGIPAGGSLRYRK